MLRTRNLLLICTLFLVLFSCSKKEEEIQIMSLEENLKDMKNKTEITLAQIRKYKVTPEDELRLVAYFYTNKQENADSLSMEFGKQRFAVNTGEYSKEKPWVINVKTDYVKMEDEIIFKWTEEMVKTGQKYHCVMEGWSTNPKQPKKLPEAINP